MLLQCLLVLVVESQSRSDVRKIGDVDEGVIEGSEDACDAEDELACVLLASAVVYERMQYRLLPYLL